MVTEGDKSLTPRGKLEGGRPIGVLWGGCGTERFALPIEEWFIEGPWIVPRGGGGCC